MVARLRQVRPHRGRVHRYGREVAVLERRPQARAHLPRLRKALRARRSRERGLVPAFIVAGTREVGCNTRLLGRTRTLESHASRVRRKLNVTDDDRYIVNVWGVGYRLLD